MRQAIDQVDILIPIVKYSIIPYVPTCSSGPVRATEALHGFGTSLICIDLVFSRVDYSAGKSSSNEFGYLLLIK